ncbi:MAG TPA: TPM domain-containing protein [Pyrinomonadaceae bacterium]
MNTRRSFAKSNFLLLIVCLLASLNVFSQEFSINESPLGAPTSPVMDYAGVLEAGAKQALEKRIIEFRDRTNPKVELAVAIVKTTGDRPIFDYSLAVARGWKIGSKETDNPSALLFIAIDDRKYFTHVSKDLEDELPDGVVGQLQRQYLVPAFKQGDYTKGVTDTIEAYIRTIESKGNVAAPPINNAPTTGRTRERTGIRTTSSLSGICCLAIAFIVIMAIFSGRSRRNRNNNNRWRGGGFGGGGGSVLPWVVGSVIANSVSNSSSSDWGSSSSSSDWGGSSGGDSWGGFGGGGDFGGGGAGGDW